MTEAFELLTWVLLAAGSVFAIIGGLGLVRFPDFYSRIHAVGVTDTLGAGLILAACAVEAGFTLLTAKILTIWIAIYLTGPAATHALAKAAYATGLAVEGEQEKPRDVIPA